MGSHGTLGRRELDDLFHRAANHELAPAPLCVDTANGPRHYEARFAPSRSQRGRAVIFADITVWKRALAEKEAMLHAVREDMEKPIAVCAACGAIKSTLGEWGPAGGLAVSTIPRDRISHGLCPACLAEQLGHLGLTQSAVHPDLQLTK
jgi:hypothetical protein